MAKFCRVAILFSLLNSALPAWADSPQPANTLPQSLADNEKFQQFIGSPIELYRLKVQGIKNKAAAENAAIFTSIIPAQELDGTAQSLNLIKQNIEKAIGVFGYFNSHITFTVTQPKSKKEKEGLIVATVDQGKQTTIAKTNVQILGEASKDSAFTSLLETQLPKVGTPLSQQAYENFKTKLQQLSLERGYFDGDFTQAQLDVKPSTQQAWWNITYQSGVRYHFGNIAFAHNKIADDYLRHIMHFKQGDAYNMQDLSTFSSDLSSSGWFKAVLVEPSVNKKAHSIDLLINAYPRKKNVFNVGLGYATDVGPRFQLGWLKPWIDSRGQSLNSNLYLSKPKQTVEAAYRIPLLAHPLRYYYEVSYGLEREDDKESNTKTNATTGEIMRYWNRVTGWQNAIGLRIRFDSFTQASESHKTLLIYPTVSATRTRFRGGIFPDWGDSQRITFDYGTKGLFSDVNFYKIQGHTTWIRTFADNHRFITRASVGYLHTNEFNRISPSLRFFAGGDRSVRGYGYKKISPRDKDGLLTGASRLATASIEYNYRVAPNWWLASFYDAGLAANSFARQNIHAGAGVGLRWVSPVGPVKLDIATPVGRFAHTDGRRKFQFYLGLGTAL